MLLGHQPKGEETFLGCFYFESNIEKCSGEVLINNAWRCRIASLMNEVYRNSEFPFHSRLGMNDFVSGFFVMHQAKNQIYEPFVLQISHN